MIVILRDFFANFRQKMAFFSKSYVIFFSKTSSTANIFSNFSVENILKIIRSVPGYPNFRQMQVDASFQILFSRTPPGGTLSALTA
jgi:hypothetical protein